MMSYTYYGSILYICMTCGISITLSNILYDVILQKYVVFPFSEKKKNNTHGISIESLIG